MYANTRQTIILQISEKRMVWTIVSTERSVPRGVLFAYFQEARYRGRHRNCGQFTPGVAACLNASERLSIRSSFDQAVRSSMSRIREAPELKLLCGLLPMPYLIFYMLPLSLCHQPWSRESWMRFWRRGMSTAKSSTRYFWSQCLAQACPQWIDLERQLFYQYEGCNSATQVHQY